MSRTPQKRQSCEACRARKLRCSGERSGCSRCLKASLLCNFHDKGVPGRPRKRKYLLASSSDPGSTSESSISPLFLSDTSHPLIEPYEAEDLLMDDGIFDKFSLELLAGCHPSGTSETDIPELSVDTSAAPLLLPAACQCTDEVTNIVRALKEPCISHGLLSTLRQGADTFERLLVCAICYDLTESPRVTIQNVLLIGRLIAELTSGYQKYLTWVTESCDKLVEDNHRESVHLTPDFEIRSDLRIEISGDKLQEIIIQGLQVDAERLTRLGKRFDARQKYRHLVGHEACPDFDGGCWREKSGIEYDPLDICPESDVAHTLIPCFRVAHDVCERIKLFADAVK